MAILAQPDYTANINGSTSADVNYVHTDHLNTPRVITTSTKSIFKTWYADPWGNAGTNGSSYRLRFPGQYYDGETGNMQNWMRDYDPETGRYLQSDPIGLRGGINTYVYGRGNPTRFYDPSGTDIWLEGPS